MNTMHRSVMVLALAGAVFAAAAQPARAQTGGRKGRRARSTPTAKRLVEQRVRSLVRKYRATDAQKKRLEKLAERQIRDLESLDRTNSAKGKDLQRRIDPLQSTLRDLKARTDKAQQELRKLQDEMLKLEASRKALLHKQADELEGVITERQRVVQMADELIRRHVRGLWDIIDDGKRERVTRAAQDAARKIVGAEAKVRRDVERAAVKELTGALVKTIGPAMTDMLREDAINRAAGAYRKVDLTDEQKAKIHALVERFNAEQVKRQQRLVELEAQLKTLRAETSRKASEALKQAIMATVLTPEQRERMKPKEPKDGKEKK